MQPHIFTNTRRSCRLYKQLFPSWTKHTSLLRCVRCWLETDKLHSAHWEQTYRSILWRSWLKSRGRKRYHQIELTWNTFIELKRIIFVRSSGSDRSPNGNQHSPKPKTALPKSMRIITAKLGKQLNSYWTATQRAGIMLGHQIASDDRREKTIDLIPATNKKRL